MGKPRTTQEHSDLELWVEIGGMTWQEFQECDIIAIQKLKEYRQAVQRGQDRKAKKDKLNAKSKPRRR